MNYVRQTGGNTISWPTCIRLVFHTAHLANTHCVCSLTFLTISYCSSSPVTTIGTSSKWMPHPSSIYNQNIMFIHFVSNFWICENVKSGYQPEHWHHQLALKNEQSYPLGERQLRCPARLYTGTKIHLSIFPCRVYVLLLHVDCRPVPVRQPSFFVLYQLRGLWSMIE